MERNPGRLALPNPSVMFILPLLAGGGAERVTLLLERGLKKRGWNTSLLLFSKSGPLDPGGAEIHNLDRPRLRQAAQAVLREIWRRRPDYVVSTLGYINIVLGLLHPMMPRRTRLVLREANMPSTSLPQSPSPLFTRMGYRLAMPRANCVIATSQRMAAEFRRDFHVQPQRLAVLPNPVEEAIIRLKAADQFLERPETNRTVQFVFAGRLEHQKGLDRILPLLARLEAPWRLTVFGDGSKRVDWQQAATNLGMGDRINFAGHVEQPYGAIAAADALILPSRWEGMPNVALEALALGTSVIATPEAGGIQELADIAPPGAVAVVEMGENPDTSPFLDVMRSVEHFGKRQPSPSMLPASHQIEPVIDHFERILKACR